MSPLVAAVIVEGALIALLLAAGAGLFRRIKELELATYKGVGLQLGGPGSAVSLVVPGRAAAVIKVSQQCVVCDQIVQSLSDLPAPEGVELVLVTDSHDPRPVSADRVRVIRDSDVWRSLNVPYAPALLHVDGTGVVRNATPIGSLDGLHDMLDSLNDRSRSAKL